MGIFSIYKSGQGKYTRIGTSLGIGIIITVGCYQFYNTLRMLDFGLSQRVLLWVNIMIPAVLFVILGFLLFRLINRPSIADFMIAGEGEMKKVSWSSRKEIFVSTLIVIIVVIIMAFLLGVSDLLFQVIFRKIITGSWA